MFKPQCFVNISVTEPAYGINSWTEVELKIAAYRNSLPFRVIQRRRDSLYFPYSRHDHMYVLRYSHLSVGYSISFNRRSLR